MEEEQNFTAKDVAQWMIDEIGDFRYLYQATAAQQIRRIFGEKFTYTNKNYNLAIGKDVLVEFERLSAGEIVWLQNKFAWRRRQEGDAPGRKQRYGQ